MTKPLALVHALQTGPQPPRLHAAYGAKQKWLRRQVGLALLCWSAALVAGAPEQPWLIDVPDSRDFPPTAEICTFQAPTESPLVWPSGPQAQKTSSFDRTPESVIRIVNRFHVVRRSDGSGGVDEALIAAMMLDLNYGFRNTPFVFDPSPSHPSMKRTISCARRRAATSIDSQQDSRSTWSFKCRSTGNPSKQGTVSSPERSEITRAGRWAAKARQAQSRELTISMNVI